MKKYLILFAGCTLLMAACSDFLELDESVYQTTKYQFSTFDRVKQSATNVYSYVQEGLLDVEGTMIDAATDDAVYAWSTGGIKRFYDGSWNGTNLIDDRWASLYSAIHDAGGQYARSGLIRRCRRMDRLGMRCRNPVVAQDLSGDGKG